MFVITLDGIQVFQGFDNRLEIYARNVVVQVAKALGIEYKELKSEFESESLFQVSTGTLNISDLQELIETRNAAKGVGTGNTFKLHDFGERGNVTSTPELDKLSEGARLRVLLQVPPEPGDFDNYPQRDSLSFAQKARMFPVQPERMPGTDHLYGTKFYTRLGTMNETVFKATDTVPNVCHGCNEAPNLCTCHGDQDISDLIFTPPDNPVAAKTDGYKLDHPSEVISREE